MVKVMLMCYRWQIEYTIAGQWFPCTSLTFAGFGPKLMKLVWEPWGGSCGDTGLKIVPLLACTNKLVTKLWLRTTCSYFFLAKTDGFSCSRIFRCFDLNEDGRDSSMVNSDHWMCDTVLDSYKKQYIYGSSGIETYWSPEPVLIGWGWNTCEHHIPGKPPIGGKLGRDAVNVLNFICSWMYWLSDVYLATTLSLPSHVLHSMYELDE